MSVADFLTDKPWWHAEDKETLGRQLQKRIQTLENNQSHIYEDMRKYAEAYSGHTELHRASDWQRTLIRSSFEENNICRQAVDQLTNIIAKSPVIPVAVASGDWKSQRQVRKFNKAIEGEFIYCGAFNAGVRQASDGLTMGTGVQKVNADTKGAYLKRVIAYDFLVDEWCVRSGQDPTEVFERMFMPMHEITATYGDCEHLDEIARANAKHNVIEVFEAYYADEECGRRVVICGEYVLEDKPWRESWVPYAIFHWSHAFTGLYGVGAVEQIFDIQVALNAINKFIRICQERVAVPRIYVDSRSGNMVAKFSDGIGIVIPFRGRPPVHLTPQALTAEIYNERIRLSREEWKLRLRMNEFATSGSVPSRVESGSAMSKMSANQMGLVGTEVARWEKAQQDIAELMIKMLKKANEGGGDVNVKWNSGNVLEQIRWGDVDLDGDRFQVHMEAQNARTLSPGFRLDAIVTRSMLAPVDPVVINRLLGGDLSAEHEDALANADLGYVDMVIDQMFDGEAAPVPDPSDPLALHMERTRQAVKLAQTKGAPDEVIDELLDYISRCEKLMQPPEAPAMQPPVEGGTPEQEAAAAAAAAAAAPATATAPMAPPVDGALPVSPMGLPPDMIPQG